MIHYPQKGLLFLILIFCSLSSQAKRYPVSSPNGRITLTVDVNKHIYYQVTFDKETILDFSPIALETIQGTLGNNPTVLSVDSQEVDETVRPLYWTRSVIKNHYNELTIKFKGNYALIFRVYDNGVGYRFQTSLKDKLTIVDETVEYRFPTYAWGWLPEGNTYETSWEYDQIFSLDKTKTQPLPLVIEPIEFNHKIKVAITEADLLDYPSLFLKKADNYENWLESSFQAYPLETQQGGYNNFSQVVSRKADYIAKTEGKRKFPWRVMIITDNDGNLVDNDLVYLLSEPQADGDWTWVKPGQAAWDWWHDYNIENADFKTGINTKTYLRHIDFAAKYGIPYVNIDWKWSDPKDIFLTNPEMDMAHIFSYARSKGVRLFLWCVSYTLDRQLQETLDLFEKWGAAGIKIDFFDRDDQLTNQMYERIAKEAAKRQLLVNFHGCAKPTGLHRKYPNIISYEAVKGLEGSKWGKSITPNHQTNIPFIRQLCGPMDFTPGAMRNFNHNSFKPVYPPGSQGTRCLQLATYVVYHQPLVMLCDMPTAYEAEPAYTRFLTNIPTTWHDTKVLKAKLGEYVVVARCYEDKWYIGAITNKHERQLTITCSFLDTNTEYRATLVQDGINANKMATDYTIFKQNNINQKSTFTLNLKQGGGAVILLQKE